MLRSMTGFGSATGVVDGVEFSVEIRSVNNRYLRTIVKLPESWMHAEAEAEKLLRNELHRGHVTLSVRMKVSDEQAAYRVNTSALRKYIDQMKVLETDGGLTLRIDLGSLLQLPGVCEPPPMDEICRRTRDGLMKLIAQAVGQLVEMRKQEGRAIEDDLFARCDQVEKGLAVVSERSPLVVQDYRDRLFARVKELTDSGEISLDAESLVREVAIFAERSDVAEEISRLKGHLEQFRKATSASEPSGRKLDFLTQEMLRESNTIGSKANDAMIAREVVDMKTAIDRIKEQVQNVE